jgi:hypothetical protein
MLKEVAASPLKSTIGASPPLSAVADQIEG